MIPMNKCEEVSAPYLPAGMVKGPLNTAELKKYRMNGVPL